MENTNKAGDMENEYTILIDILIKMNAGLTLTETEQQLWDEWINRPDVKGRQFFDEKDIDICILISSRNQSFDDFLKEMEEREANCSPTLQEEIRSQSRWTMGKLHSRFLGFRKIAVTIIIIGILATMWRIFLQKDPVNETVPWRTVIAAKQKNKEVLLPEGTVVFLDAYAKLSYPEKFAPDKRIVKLEGQAFFNVKKSNNIPFMVETDHQQIEVTGTQFNVDDHLTSEFVTTTLLEGSVTVTSLTGKGLTCKLQPGERSTIKKDGQLIVEKLPDSYQSIAWMRDCFYFKEVPLTEIIYKLEDWYKVHFIFEEGIEDEKYTIGYISRQESITLILDILHNTGNIKFQTENNSTIRILKDAK